MRLAREDDVAVAARMIGMLVASGAAVAVGTFAMHHALDARRQAEGAAAAQARAAEAVHRGAEGLAGEAQVEPPRPQGGFGDGVAPATFDLSRHETLAPRDAQVEGGERVAPFEGFGVQVDSVPAGARVVVDGADLGETPLTASVRCAPGAEVAVRVVRQGWRPWERRTRCRDDALVLLDARLAR